MLYPLKFRPILKEKIWGWDILKALWNKTSKNNKEVETWELSTFKNEIPDFKNVSSKGENLLKRDKIKKCGSYSRRVNKKRTIGKGILIEDIQQTLNITYHFNNGRQKTPLKIPRQ
ncbi:hypothetical protein GCM10009430_07220 [Aquimarina litoralis]|uniref:Uncharacterized protein n=1 Tax=Aquimarina litoralis TaxID=584605 RepID=A0ABP3TP33_9FLAO